MNESIELSQTVEMAGNVKSAGRMSDFALTSASTKSDILSVRNKTGIISDRFVTR